MKFLREFVQADELENIVESKDGEKRVRLKGIFTEAESKNKNGRIYPLSILEREMYKLQQRIISTGLTGELDHPERPDYCLANAAFKIDGIKQDGNLFLGEGTILKDTEKGKTAYFLAKAGIKMGISSRALGSLNEKDGVNYVCEDLNMICFDLVADPSSPSAWLENIMEKTDWIIDNGYIKENTIITMKNEIKALPSIRLKEGIDEIFGTFLKNI